MTPKQLEMSQADLASLRDEARRWWVDHNTDGMLPNGKPPTEAEFNALAWMQACLNILYRKGVVENLTIQLDTDHYEPIEDAPAVEVEEPQPT